jgi:hypothetical protein
MLGEELACQRCLGPDSSISPAPLACIGNYRSMTRSSGILLRGCGYPPKFSKSASAIRLFEVGEYVSASVSACRECGGYSSAYVPHDETAKDPARSTISRRHSVTCRFSRHRIKKRIVRGEYGSSGEPGAVPCGQAHFHFINCPRQRISHCSTAARFLF